MIKKTLKTVLITTLILLVVLLSIKTEKCYQEARKQPKTVYLRDTITNVLYDTVFFDHFETIKLPVVDTTVYYITDTLTRVDSIEVEIPISKYSVDTTFVTDSTIFNLSIRNSGYAVTLDSIYYRLEYTPTKQKKIHWFIGPSLGIGYDFINRKLVPTVGIGLIIKRF